MLTTPESTCARAFHAGRARDRQVQFLVRRLLVSDRIRERKGGGFMFLPQIVAASLALAAALTSEGVALFLSGATVGRAAPTECVEAAVSRLRDQLAHDARVRLVEKREQAFLVVEVRECGSRWKNEVSGVVGVGVTLGGGRVTRTGTSVEGGVGVQRRRHGYVILRGASVDRRREFSSLDRTEYFDEAVSVAAGQLLDWVEELQPERTSR
jgi:hypothetical protein